MRATRLGVLIVSVTLVVSGGAAGATHTDVIETPIETSEIAIDLRVVADGFTTPLWAINAPGDSRRLFVVDQIGKIWTIGLNPRGSTGRTLFLDVGVDGLDLLVPLGAFGPGTFDERGLLGLAFHPDYRSNGLFYTYTSEPVDGPADFTTLDAGEEANSQSVIREWSVPDPRNSNSVADPASSRILLTIDQPQFNHNAGALNFGPDGHLYIAIGDGGAADDQGIGHADGGNGQDLSPGNVLGKILRIDPTGSNSANGQYGIPADNPTVGPDAAEEIYAYGFRNPFRFSFDTRTGRLWAADVGQNDIEEVDIVRAGGNYGWPVKEGSFLFDMNGDEPGFTTDFSPRRPRGLIDPVAEYDHDEGVSITGGFVYRGRSIPGLRGSYVFGDFTRSFAGPQGRIFHLGADRTIFELASTEMFVTGFGQDRSGEMYVLGTQSVAPVGTTGVVMRIAPAD